MIDLLIVGGGPAGLATALYGARAGLEVVVAERRSGVLDKACGEGMMPHTVAHLERLGVDPNGRPLRGIRYLDGVRHVDATFRAGKGRGVRRTVLSAAMRDAAEEVGVRLVRDDIRNISQDEDSVRAGPFRARYLAAADGLHSPIRRDLGLARPDRGPRRWGIRRHIHVPPWTDCVEVHWSSGGEAYVTPVDDDCVGIAILSSKRGGFDAHFHEFPALRERVLGCQRGADRAAGPLRQRVASRAAGRVLLVGDAAGYTDALTGGPRAGVRRSRIIGAMCGRRPPGRLRPPVAPDDAALSSTDGGAPSGGREPAAARRHRPSRARLAQPL